MAVESQHIAWPRACARWTRVQETQTWIQVVAGQFAAVVIKERGTMVFDIVLADAKGSFQALGTPL